MAAHIDIKKDVPAASFLLSKKVGSIRERPLLQGVPSFKTVHRTVLKFTLCGALIRLYVGLCPTPHQRLCLWNPLKGWYPFRIPELMVSCFFVAIEVKI